MIGEKRKRTDRGRARASIRGIGNGRRTAGPAGRKYSGDGLGICGLCILTFLVLGCLLCAGGSEVEADPDDSKVQIIYHAEGKTIRIYVSPVQMVLPMSQTDLASWGVFKEGHTLDHWISEEPDGKVYRLNEQFSVSSGELDLYPIWSKNSYWVIFPQDLIIKQSGNPIGSSQEIAYGTELTIEVKQKEGYTREVFLNGQKLTKNKFTVGLQNDLRVVDTLASYTITFDPSLTVSRSGVGIPSGTEVDYGTELIFTVQEQEGNRSVVYLNGQEIQDRKFKMNGITELHVEYIPIDYPVTFEDGLIVRHAGIAIQSGTAIPYGTTLTVEAPQKAGYTSKIILDGRELTENEFTVGSSDVSLTVVWEKSASVRPTPIIPDGGDVADRDPVVVVPDGEDGSQSQDGARTTLVVAAIAAIIGELAVLAFLRRNRARWGRGMADRRR